MSRERRGVIFGAGNVGRGFLGQLLSESGYRVLFVDVYEPLVRALAERGSYTLQLVTDSKVEELEISGVSAVSSFDREVVAQAVAECDLAATAVGVGALPKLAPTVAAGLEQRRLAGRGPLNLIICENLRNAPDLFAEMLRPHLPKEGRAFLQEQVGLVDAVIGRMVPLIPKEISEQDPSLIMAEPYKVLPVNRDRFRGEIPDVVGMEARDNFAAYVDQKLFTHNAGHAMIAYLGYLNGYEYGYQALNDPLVRGLTEQAMEESSDALVRRHGINPAEQYAHVQDLLVRFRNHRLGDTIFRLGRDPIRKLGPEDRLAGAARLVVETGGRPTALAWGIAAGLLFDPAEDESAQRLQSLLRERPIEVVLQQVSGIEPGSQLSDMVIQSYRSLSAGNWPETTGGTD